MDGTKLKKRIVLVYKKSKNEKTLVLSLKFTGKSTFNFIII